MNKKEKYTLTTINAILVNKNHDEIICNFDKPYLGINKISKQHSTLELFVINEDQCIDLYNKNLTDSDIKRSIISCINQFISIWLPDNNIEDSVYESDIIYTMPYHHGKTNEMSIVTVVPISDDTFDKFRNVLSNNERDNLTLKLLNTNDISITNIDEDNIVVSRSLSTAIALWQTVKNASKCKCGGKCHGHNDKQENKTYDTTVVLHSFESLPNGNIKSLMYYNGMHDIYLYPQFSIKLPYDINKDGDISKLVNSIISLIEDENSDDLDTDSSYILASLIQEIVTNPDNASVNTNHGSNLVDTGNCICLDIKVPDFNDIQSFLDSYYDATSYVVIEQTANNESNK